jgi:hypothetical protein
MARYDAPRGSIMNTHCTNWIVPLFGLLASACASTPVTPALPQGTVAFTSQPAAFHELVSFERAGHDERCAVVRRGLAGEVHDARLAERWPDKNYGGVTSSFAGRVAGADRDTLLSFSLPEIPGSAEITRAELRLYEHVSGTSPVSLHRVTGAWSESTVTWNSFAGAYELAPTAMLPVVDGGVGHVRVDVTALAREWHQDSDNHGIVLRQSSANTSFATSEASDPEQRPTLAICWRPTSFARLTAY